MKVAIAALAVLLLVGAVLAVRSVEHGRELTERAHIFDRYCEEIFRRACREVEAPLQLPHKLPDPAALLACTNAATAEKASDERATADPLKRAYKLSCALVTN